MGRGKCIGVFGWVLVVLVVAAAAPSAALSAGDANRAVCPAETESSPGFRSYMPDCRAFELVTPPYKEGAAFAIVYARLLRGEHEPMRGLSGELMGMIVLPYLGPAAARREQARAAPSALPAQGSPAGNGAGDRLVVARAERDPLEGIPMRLTYRTARVLEDIAEHPGVSNRLIAEYAGITDQGQVSKLLARLERLGLIENTGPGHARGERNAWRLSPTGVRVTQSIRTRTHDQGAGTV